MKLKISSHGPGIGVLDNRYVEITGDTMTGILRIASADGIMLALDSKSNTKQWAILSGQANLTISKFDSPSGLYQPQLSLGSFKVHNDFIGLDEISTPATPSANDLRIYAKDEGGTSKLFYKGDDGTEIGPLGTAGASTALDNLASVQINTDLIPDADSTHDIGDSSNHFSHFWVDKIYNKGISTSQAILHLDLAIPVWRAPLSIAPDGTTRFKVTSSGVDFVSSGVVSHIIAATDSTYDLGSNSISWKDVYTDKLLLNSTATLDGTSAGIVKVTGKLDMNLSEIINAKTENVGALPSAGNLGRVLYLTSDSHLYLDQG